MKSVIVFVAFCSLLTVSSGMAAQTFEVQGQNAPAQKTQVKPGKAQKGKAAKVSAPSQRIGWGSSIEVGRMARAEQDALQHNNPVQAASFAERAANAAPQDAKLWFLLGYTSRLAGKNQQSLTAYQRGLTIAPNSVDGLSGMAQTYAKMGQIDQAKRLLLQVVRENPRRQNDLLMAGELFLTTGDTQQGITLLQRAEAVKPTSRAELMMAVAYLISPSVATRITQPSSAPWRIITVKSTTTRMLSPF